MDPFSFVQFGFLEAPLVQQAAGELKNWSTICNSFFYQLYYRANLGDDGHACVKGHTIELLPLKRSKAG